VLDTRAAECLNASDTQGFLLRYLPGLSLLQVGGQLVEITASALGSLIVAFLVSKYLHSMKTSPEPLLTNPVASAY
jgi:hypothetical protein